MEKRNSSAEEHVTAHGIDGIPVIAASNPSEDGISTQPRAIHLNPKFFKKDCVGKYNFAQSREHIYPEQHHLKNEPEQGFQPCDSRVSFPETCPPPQYAGILPPFPPPPFQSGVSRFQKHFNSIRPPHDSWLLGHGYPRLYPPRPFPETNMGTFPPTYHNFVPPPRQFYPRYRYDQNFNRMQQPSFGFQEFRYPNQRNAGYQSEPGPLMPTPQQWNPMRADLTPPNVSYFGTNLGTHHHHTPTDTGPASVYANFERDNSRGHCETALDETYNRNRRSRSRSRSPHSSINSGYTNTRTTSRSRSSSPRSQRSRSFSGERYWTCSSDGRSSSSSINDESDVNSDSDFDLSKSLGSLAENVSDSKRLLKDAIKCLGGPKFTAMIPTELQKFGRRNLLNLFKKLLDETDNEELLGVMSGNINKTEEIYSSSSESEHSNSSSASPDDRVIKPASKTHKKKRSKKRKNKRRKEDECNSKSEPETCSDDESSGESEETRSRKNPVKASSTSGGVNQSLLELIQIEYKTKAINVMLRNLGVASDISSLVSNVLGSAPQNVTPSDLDPKPSSQFHEQLIVSGEMQNQPKTPVEHLCDNGDMTDARNLNLYSASDEDDLSVKLDCDNQNSASQDDSGVLLNETESEYLKDIDNDILDLGVGTFDKLNLPDN